MLKIGHGDWLHLKLFRINSAWTAIRALVGWPMLVLGLYMLAALVGSLIPVNNDWLPAKRGQTIYLYDNGVHTSLILRRDHGMDMLGVTVADFPVVPNIVDDHYYRTPVELPKIIPLEKFPGDIDVYPYIMIGWGDAQFYRDTPTWSQVSPSTAMAALTGTGEALIHVDRLKRIPTRNTRKLVLRKAEYDRVVEFVSSHFSSTIATMPRVEKGYGLDDRFYPVSTDGPPLRYSALFTCNNWINEALKAAGVKTGLWTPLPFGVMWWH
jgi:uncharacterized protein (TIGR02117 family)